MASRTKKNSQNVESVELPAGQVEGVVDEVPAGGHADSPASVPAPATVPEINLTLGEMTVERVGERLTGQSAGEGGITGNHITTLDPRVFRVVVGRGWKLRRRFKVRITITDSPKRDK